MNQEEIQKKLETARVNVTINFNGGEPVTFEGLTMEQSEVLSAWIKGHLGKVYEFILGDTKILLNRELVTNVVFSITEGSV